MVYGLFVLQAGIPEGAKLFDLIAVTIALSIILHSSTDVPVAHKLRIEPPDHLPAGHEPVEAPPAEHPCTATGSAPQARKPEPVVRPDSSARAVGQPAAAALAARLAVRLPPAGFDAPPRRSR